MTLTIHHLVSKWRNGSVLPLLSLWAFRACSLTYDLSTNFCVNLSSLVHVAIPEYRFSFNYRRNEQESLQLKSSSIFQFSLSSFKDYIWLTYSAFTNIINPLKPELNPSAQRCLTRFLLGILLLEPCISFIYAWKPNKYTNYSFGLLIMYGSSYMFWHYIAILRERS
jgi:hypothetical protein